MTAPGGRGPCARNRRSGWRPLAAETQPLPTCLGDITRRALLRIVRSAALTDTEVECVHQRKADVSWMRIYLTEAFPAGDILRTRRH